jgi:hypothetical protein
MLHRSWLSTLILAGLCAQPAAAQVQEFVAFLDSGGAQGNGSPARGRGRFLFDPAADTLEYYIEYGGLLGNEFASHLHIRTCLGFPTLLGLSPQNPKIGVLPMNDDLECELLSGDSWINIHTDYEPSGEIAGYVLPVPDTITSFCPGVGCPCGNDDPLAGCANSSGQGALLLARGSASILHDNLILEAAPVPSGKTGLFFLGTQATSLPFGDGMRCVGGSLYRLAVRVSNGGLSIGPGLVAGSRFRFPASGQIRVGSTWTVQAWYQDSAGPCGSGVNMSDALSILFTP